MGMNRGGGVAQWARAFVSQAEGWVFESKLLVMGHRFIFIIDHRLE